MLTINLLIFTNKASSHVVIVNISESLECAKVVVLKLGAILFDSITESILNLQNYEKKYREDLNRYIPQKINEFASLAVAGRYP